MDGNRDGQEESVTERESDRNKSVLGGRGGRLRQTEAGVWGSEAEPQSERFLSSTSMENC